MRLHARPPADPILSPLQTRPRLERVDSSGRSANLVGGECGGPPPGRHNLPAGKSCFPDTRPESDRDPNSRVGDQMAARHRTRAGVGQLHPPLSGAALRHPGPRDRWRIRISQAISTACCSRRPQPDPSYPGMRGEIAHTSHVDHRISATLHFRETKTMPVTLRGSRLVKTQDVLDSTLSAAA